MKLRSLRVNQFKMFRDAEAAESRMVKASSAAASILTTDDALERLRKADSELFRVETQLGAAATRITFKLDGAQQPGIQVDGRPLSDVLRDETQPLERVEPMEIDIPEVGLILIDPNVIDREELLQSREQADSQRREALSAAGADSLEDAEEKNLLRLEHVEQERGAQSEIAAFAPDGVEVLRQKVETERNRLAGLPPAVWSQANKIPDDSADGTINDRITNLKIEEGALRVRLASIAESVENLAESIEQQGEKLRQAELETSDDQLASDVDAAKQEFEVVDAVYKTLESERPDMDREQLEKDIKELDLGLEARSNQRIALNKEIAVLRDRIDRDEAAGIDEDIAGTENDLEQARRELARLEREVAVLDLLTETLTKAENDAKDRYLEPVLQNVLPYLERLFPDSAIGIDNNLNITEITRNASHEEPFVNLSMGTREQIAVLVRLALAKLLAERGTPAVVVLDDALIYSDDVRMRLMFDILIEAAKDVQIIVFTCREQLFEDLPAHKLHITRGGQGSQLTA